MPRPQRGSDRKFRDGAVQTDEETGRPVSQGLPEPDKRFLEATISRDTQAVKLAQAGCTDKLAILHATARQTDLSPPAEPLEALHGSPV